MVPFIGNTGVGTRFGGECDQSNLEHVECEVPGDSQIEIVVSRGDKQIRRVLGNDLG